MSVLPRDVLANPRLSQWVGVCGDGTIEVRVGKVELGQGILTALAQLAAEQLGVPLAQVRMVPASTVAGPDQGPTAGSMSVFTSAPALSLVCAHVRTLFAAEAARRWGLGPEQVRLGPDGCFCTDDGGRRAAYGELAGSVDLDVEADPDVPVEGTGGVVLVGTSATRIDLPDKIAGLPRYIADLRLPGQLFGRVVRPPSPGARLLAVDTRAAGVDVQVVVDGSFLGVVGADETQVTRAAERLRGAASWAEQDTLPDEDDLVGFLRTGPHESVRVVDEDDLGPEDGQVVSARYSRPFLAHASIAPSCGIARWEKDGTVSVWSHSQGIHRLGAAIAAALELSSEQVRVDHVANAGSYGHNGADDAAFDAVLLARAVPGRPVQVQWSRADELSWAPFGSAMAVEVVARLHEGRISGWRYDVWSQGHAARPGFAGVCGLLAGAHLARPLALTAPEDPPLTAGAGTARNAVPIYAVGSRRITSHRLLRAPLRSSALRSLGAFMNVFSIESFLDELARAAGQDPLAFRLAHLTDERGRQVLETAAAAAGWGQPVSDGMGRGLGFARYKERGAYCAVVAEVEAEREIRLCRLSIAVDVGRVVNPDGVRNQIEGGAIQAASWTLRERVRFDRRRVTSVDWETYPILRFSEVPEIDVELLDRPELPSVGAGEAAQGPTAAAIGNAVAAALGVRVRDLPITTDAVVAAIEEVTE